MRIAAPRTARIVYARVVRGVRWWLQNELSAQRCREWRRFMGKDEASGLLGKSHNRFRDKAHEQGGDGRG